MSWGPYFSQLPQTGTAPVALASATNANPVRLTFVTAHGVPNGNPVVLSGGTGAWAAINGSFTATVISPLILTIAVNSTGFGAVTGAIVSAGVPKRYVDQPSWDASIDNHVTWKGDVNGGGFKITNVVIQPGSAGFSGLGVLSFPTIVDGGEASLTFALSGASVGDTVAPGWPATLEVGLTGMMFVSATDTIQVRLQNFSGADVTPAAAQTFRATSGAGDTPGAATLVFPLILDGTSAVLTFPLVGAIAGNPVTPGWPSTLEAGLIGFMRISATDTIEVRLQNNTGADMTPAVQVFKATT